MLGLRDPVRGNTNTPAPHDALCKGDARDDLSKLLIFSRALLPDFCAEAEESLRSPEGRPEVFLGGPSCHGVMADPDWYKRTVRRPRRAPTAALNRTGLLSLRSCATATTSGAQRKRSSKHRHFPPTGVKASLCSFYAWRTRAPTALSRSVFVKSNFRPRRQEATPRRFVHTQNA
jgi:hypothetical protein